MTLFFSSKQSPSVPVSENDTRITHKQLLSARLPMDISRLFLYITSMSSSCCFTTAPEYSSLIGWHSCSASKSYIFPTFRRSGRASRVSDAWKPSSASSVATDFACIKPDEHEAHDSISGNSSIFIIEKYFLSEHFSIKDLIFNVNAAGDVSSSSL